MIRLDRVHKYFHRHESHEVHAICGIELTIGQGEFVTMIGSNGSGKSTLLNCIAGVQPIDSGRIFIGGRHVTNLDAAHRAALIGRVFQDPLEGTAGSLSIAENLAIALKRGTPRQLKSSVSSDRRVVLRASLAQLGLGLESRMNVPVRLLSGGQRQALTLLMATLVTPQVLLLDEPTAALDPAAAALITELTVRLVAEHGLTTLMVTHNMQQALSLGTRTLIMDKGRIIRDIQEVERAGLTVEDLAQHFMQGQMHMPGDGVPLSNS